MNRKKQEMKPLSRRHFLRGAGGFALAIPFLPSLLTKEALAATASPKRFIYFHSSHGALRPQWLFPFRNDGMSPVGSTSQYWAVPNLAEFVGGARTTVSMSTQQLYSNHMIRRGALSGLLYSANGRTGISPVLSSATSGRMSAALIAKMHLHEGLDVPWYLSHNRGLLGNTGNSDHIFNEDSSLAGPIPQVPSIDQILAWSSKVYAGGGFAQRFMNVATFGGDSANSWTYTNSNAFTDSSSNGGSIKSAASQGDLGSVFNNLFSNFTGGGGGGGSTTTTTVSPQKLLVDRAYDSWKNLVSGGFGAARRLSMDDKTRLEGFMAKLADLQTQINSQSTTTTTVSNSCSKPTGNYGGVSTFGNSVSEFMKSYELATDIMAAAFACDRTRVSHFNFAGFDGFAWNGDVHQDVWHSSSDPSKQRLIVQGMQNHFDIFAGLAAKMNSYAEGAGTVLDNSLVSWSHECGPDTHNPTSIPVIAFGGLSGKFQTGYYYDYRNQANPVQDNYFFGGIPLARWFASVLQGMGLSETDYLRFNNNRVGYSDGYFVSNQNKMSSSAWADRGKTLPWSYTG
jgi:hypothetical protein